MREVDPNHRKTNSMPEMIIGDFLYSHPNRASASNDVVVGGDGNFYALFHDRYRSLSVRKWDGTAWTTIASYTLSLGAHGGEVMTEIA